MTPQEEAKQRAKNYMKLKGVLEEKKEEYVPYNVIEDFMSIEIKPTNGREQEICTKSYIAGFRLATSLEEAKKVDATYPTQELEGYLHDNYIKKEAHFPLSEPKTIYISKQTHHEVSLERIKELFNIEKLSKK
jgi:hypothetical protein